MQQLLILMVVKIVELENGLELVKNLFVKIKNDYQVNTHHQKLQHLIKMVVLIVH